ncbi:hypothetical protein BD779DRAFT_1788184 [Infundibulicybe gibba]|nr:hypothetical protein BD779DRAFT_1788184 [Infundibulicybe gibba]
MIDTTPHPSAIAYLPVEIIREIFLQCLPGPCQLPPTSTEPRLVLTHVCSAWRNVALDMPKLWTDMIVDLQYSKLGVRGHSAISSWLFRSSPCLISLQIHFPAYGSSSRLFENLVLPNLHRYRHLDLRTSGAELLLFLSLPAGLLPDLEDVRIKLHHARLYIDPKAGVDLYRLNLPWAQLSILIFGRIRPIICLDILRECASLQKCILIISRIDDVAIDKLTELSKQPLLLPSLLGLSLALTNHHTLFLTALHLPNLRVFYPIGRWYSFRWSPSSLKSFLRLDRLSLFQIRPMLEDDLLELLRPLPWLTKLHLSRSDLPTSAILQGFGSGVLIPSVTSIFFGPISIEELISTLEDRFMASRAAGTGISMFNFVSSTCVRPSDPGLVPRLEALEAAGMQVEFNPNGGRSGVYVSRLGKKWLGY